MTISAGDGWHALDTGEAFYFCVDGACSAYDGRTGCTAGGEGSSLACARTAVDGMCDEGGCLN